MSNSTWFNIQKIWIFVELENQSIIFSSLIRYSTKPSRKKAYAFFKKHFVGHLLRNLGLFFTWSYSRIIWSISSLISDAWKMIVLSVDKANWRYAKSWPFQCEDSMPCFFRSGLLTGRTRFLEWIFVECWLPRGLEDYNSFQFAKCCSNHGHPSQGGPIGHRRGKLQCIEIWSLC